MRVRRALISLASIAACLGADAAAAEVTLLSQERLITTRRTGEISCSPAGGICPGDPAPVDEYQQRTSSAPGLFDESLSTADGQASQRSTVSPLLIEGDGRTVGDYTIDFAPWIPPYDIFTATGTTARNQLFVSFRVDTPTGYALTGSWDVPWLPYVLPAGVWTRLVLRSATGVVAEIECVRTPIQGCTAVDEMRTGVLDEGAYELEIWADAAGSPGGPIGYGEDGGSVDYAFRLELDPSPPVVAPALGTWARVVVGALILGLGVHRGRRVWDLMLTKPDR